MSVSRTLNESFPKIDYGIGHFAIVFPKCYPSALLINSLSYIKRYGRRWEESYDVKPKMKDNELSNTVITENT